jgi:hypothetical protein
MMLFTRQKVPYVISINTICNYTAIWATCNKPNELVDFLYCEDCCAGIMYMHSGEARRATTHTLSELVYANRKPENVTS